MHMNASWFFFAVDNAEVCHSWSSLCNLMMMTLASLINDTSRQVLSVSAFIAIWKQQCLICQLTYWWWLFVTCEKVHSSTRMKKILSYSFKEKLNTVLKAQGICIAINMKVPRWEHWKFLQSTCSENLWMDRC